MTEISRRKFIGLGLGAAGAVAAAGLLGNAFLSNNQNKESDRLKEGELEDWSEFYEIASKISTDYGGVLFPEFYNPLHSYASGMIESNNPEIVAIRDGWGSEIPNQNDEPFSSFLDRVLGEKLDSFEFTGDEASIKKLRETNFLVNARLSLPYHILSLPQQIELVPDGGWTDPDKVGLVSPEAGIEHALVTLYHEGLHNILGHFERIKPFIQKKEYIRYLTTYAQNVYKSLNEWINLSEEDALQYDFGYPPFNYDPGLDPNERPFRISILDRLENLLPTPLSEDKREDYSYRFSRIAYHVLHTKPHNGESDDIKWVRNLAVFEMHHVLIGPLGLGDGTFLDDLSQLEDRYQPFALRRLEMERLTLVTFGEPGRFSMTDSVSDIKFKLVWKSE